MTRAKQETYGAFTRRKREEKEFGLREFAKMLGVSATYVSQVERGELSPPAEERVLKTAELLEIDSDVLMALAGRVATDLEDIIRDKPKAAAVLLRLVKKMSSEQLDDLNDTLRQNLSSKPKR